jgi:energy-coupling factor transporter transmembrane protein EcfT
MEIKIIQTFLGTVFAIVFLIIASIASERYLTIKSVNLIYACASMCRPSKVDVFEYDIEADEIKECRCLR